MAGALVFVAIPAAALACQLACAAPAGSLHHHGSHGTTNAAAVRAAHPSCEHTGTIGPARIASAPRSGTTPATLTALVLPAPARDARAVTVSCTAHSPPGGLATPLPLRI